MAVHLPVVPPLVDPKARTIRYVRVSLTERCNYRCTYCMPEEGVVLAPRSDVLRFEEIVRLVRVLAQAGVRRVRLTGGEPTVRRDMLDIVAMLGELGLDDLALTTNGHTLAESAAALHQSGLRRLNISIDTLDSQRFRAITRRGDLARVCAGVDAARAAGFTGTKLNTVALLGFNDTELPRIAAWAWERDLVPRFIEWMPMSDGALFAPGGFMPAARIRTALEQTHGRLVPDDGGGIPGVGPARYWRVSGTTRRVGIISAVTEQFCDTCNRVRLSATGQLHSCLASDEALDLRSPMRAGCSDDTLLELIRGGVSIKVDGHRFTTQGCGGPKKHMVAIGG